LAYIDNNNDVYVSKYDAATDKYINSVKIILNTAIDNLYTIKLSPDGTILTLYNTILYIYRYNQVVYEYVQQLTYSYANNILDFTNVFISTSNTRIMTFHKSPDGKGKLLIFEGYTTYKQTQFIEESDYFIYYILPNQ
jgi:hypothetical protein